MQNISWKDILNQLETGKIRAAYLEDGVWKANEEVKEAILASFGAGENMAYGGIYDGFIDKNNLPPRKFLVEDNVRLVPGGSSVRHLSLIHISEPTRRTPIS